MRAVVRAPITLYRHGLGWVPGRRALMLERTGRRSGQARFVCPEVAERPGDLMGRPATDRHISVEGVEIGRVTDGQAQERWGGLNMHALPTQFGFFPRPAELTSFPRPAGLTSPSPGSTRRQPSSTWHSGGSTPVT